MVFLYAATYFRTDRRLGSLLLTLTAFAISMLGLVIADDAITLFVFWEGTTITSWLLVGFDHERASARAAALQALLVTALGGLALLAGLLLMGSIAGSYRLSEMNRMPEAFQASPLYPAIFWLVALGAFTKSAQWPFHFWLPNAMAAPTPVSAYLHSATMVKAGVYLLARLTPALGGTDLWTWVLVPVGGFTMLLASVWAMRQTDLKLMLAYTTVMALSLMVMLLGVGTPAAIVAAMTFLLIHALYKAGLFLAVGMIEKGAGARDYPAVAGLARAMPLTAAVVALAALSMAGFPPLFGFVGKELIYEATGHAPLWPALVTAAALLANALMVACAGMVALRPFFFAPQLSPKDRPADPAWGLWLGPVILAALGLLCGLLPALVGDALVAPMASAVSGAPREAHLALWHGLGTPLALSLVTFALGFLLYLLLDRIRDGLAAAEPPLPRTEGWYDAALAGLAAFALGLTTRVQSGLMTSYLRHTFLVFAALIWGAIFFGTATWPRLRHQARAHRLGDHRHHRRLDRRGAAHPLAAHRDHRARRRRLRHRHDLRALRRHRRRHDPALRRDPRRGLPRHRHGPPAALRRRALQRRQRAPRRRPRRRRHPRAALGARHRARPLPHRLLRGPQLPRGPRPQHRQRHPRRLPRLRHPGRDLGHRHRRRRRPRGPPRRPQGAAMNSLILSTCTRLLVPLILAVSVFVFFRGHNEPGGGFIGGLLAATAFALLEKAEGLAAARRALRVSPAVDRRGRPRLRAGLRRSGAASASASS